LPQIEAVATWVVETAAYALVGLALGAALIPVAGKVIAPAWAAMKGLLKRPSPAR
jgi:hypothetical protein